MTVEGHEAAILAVQRWVEEIVVGLNLCPFARREVAGGRVRYALSSAQTEAALLEALQSELEFLVSKPEIETTLLVHPQVLGHFSRYNQFLDQAEALLVGMGLEGVIQIASFHPDYRFAGTGTDDAENYTNRSPFPLLHLLRETSIEAAAATADVDAVPERNIRLMNEMGSDELRAQLKRCFRQ